MVKDKIILITGAGRGIGQACAVLLAENQAQVIINYHRSQKEALELVNKLRQKGFSAIKIRADITKENEVQHMFEIIRNKYKRLDVLVNNAGIMKNNLLLMTPISEFEEIVAVNCRGSFLCARFAAKMMMKQQEGKIINIASILGITGNKEQSVYSASKAFIIGFTKALAKELGIYNIKVNAVAPGFIKTELTQGVADKVKQDILSKIALNRFGLPLDVARVVLFLSSSSADYVSGQVIGVDGCQII